MEKEKRIRVNFLNRWLYKFKIKMIMSGLDDLEALMKIGGYSRNQRRTFWRGIIQRDKKEAFEVLKRLKI